MVNDTLHGLKYLLMLRRRFLFPSSGQFKKYSSKIILNMEAASYLMMSVATSQLTRRPVPEDRNIPT